MDKQQKGWQHFIELCHETKDEKVLSSLLDLFFTPEERNDVAMRYWIIMELLSGKKTQREIAKELNVSIAKITRGSNELKRINPQVIQSILRG